MPASRGPHCGWSVLPRGAGRTRPGDAHSGLPRGSQPSRPRGLIGKHPISPCGQPCPDTPERERAPGWTGGSCLGQSAQIRGQRGTRPSVPAGRLRPRCGEEASQEGGGGPAEEGSDPCPGRCLPPAAPGIHFLDGRPALLEEETPPGKCQDGVGVTAKKGPWKPREASRDPSQARPGCSHAIRPGGAQPSAVGRSASVPSQAAGEARAVCGRQSPHPGLSRLLLRLTFTACPSAGWGRSHCPCFRDSSFCPTSSPVGGSPWRASRARGGGSSELSVAGNPGRVPVAAAVTFRRGRRGAAGGRAPEGQGPVSVALARGGPFIGRTRRALGLAGGKQPQASCGVCADTAGSPGAAQSRAQHLPRWHVLRSSRPLSRTSTASFSSA